MVAAYWAARDSSEGPFQIDKGRERGFISLADFLGDIYKDANKKAKAKERSAFDPEVGEEDWKDKKDLVVDITEEF